MDMRQLRYFVQIVESGSLSKASRQLYIVQPALSQQMAKLEEEVGKPLLIRSARGVVPTENGEALFQHAKFLLRQLDEAVLVARRDSTEIKGRVTLGLAPSTVAAVGLPLVKRLKARYPGISLNVIAIHSGYLQEMLRTGQLDISILFHSTSASEMTCEPLFDEELFVMLPAASGLVPDDRDSLTLAEVARLPMVLPHPTHGLRRRIMVEFERAQLEFEPAAEIDSLQLVTQYAATFGAATIQPMCAYLAMNPSDPWRCLPISDTRMIRTNYLYSLPRQKLSAQAAIVCTELKQVVRELIEAGLWQGVWLAPSLAGTAGASTDAVDA